MPIRPDEPTFTLRAQDKFAPELVENWAARVDAANRCVSEKTQEARALAHMMRAWQARNVNRVKVPD